MIAGVSLCFLGGPPTDLKHMANRPEWKGQTLKKNIWENFEIVSHNTINKAFFQISMLFLKE
jgi:hypothetical protein